MSEWSRRDFLRAGLGVAAAGAVGTVLTNRPNGLATIAGAATKPAKKGSHHAATGTIQVWMHQEAAFQKAYEGVVADFKRSHPGADIKTLYIPFPELETKTITAFVGGSPPDIVKLPGYTFAQFAAKGLFAPVDPKAMGFSSMAHFTSAFEPKTTEPLQYHGKTYGVPITWNALFLFYNKDDFRAAGLNPTTPPATWEDLVTVGKKLTKYKPTGAVTRCGFQWTYGETTQWTYMDLLGLVAGLGSTILKNGKGNLSNKAGIKALTYYQDMAVKYNISSPNVTSTQFDPGLFASDKASMLISSNWVTPLLPSLNKSFHQGKDWGVAPMPKWKGRKPVTVAYTYGWAVAKTSPRASLAWEFIRFLESQSSAKAFMNEAGIIEPIKGWQKLVPHTVGYALEAKSSPHTVSGPNVPFWHKMATTLTKGLQSLVRGQTTPANVAAQFDGTSFS